MLLSVEHLVKDFPLTSHVFGRTRGRVSAVADVSLEVRRGETFGLVGESGSGKTTLGRLVVGLDEPTSGLVRVEGRDLSTLSSRERRAVRRRVQFMFQDPYASLDPRMRVGAILREPLAIQRIGNRQEQRRQVEETLDSVGLPRSAADRFPHEFSGGQRQRLGLARALILRPELVVADEPVSALDVSIQAQILNTLRDLQERLALTYVVISHDLSVIRYLSDRIGVMYLGKLVEDGPVRGRVPPPAPPLHARPHRHASPTRTRSAERAQRPSTARGELPSAIDPPSGCRFRTRCPLAQQVCADEEPPLRTLRPGHRVACHFPLEGERSDVARSVK